MLAYIYFVYGLKSYCKGLRSYLKWYIPTLKCITVAKGFYNTDKINNNRALGILMKRQIYHNLVGTEKMTPCPSRLMFRRRCVYISISCVYEQSLFIKKLF